MATSFAGARTRLVYKGCKHSSALVFLDAEQLRARGQDSGRSVVWRKLERNQRARGGNRGSSGSRGGSQAGGGSQEATSRFVREIKFVLNCVCGWFIFGREFCFLAAAFLAALGVPSEKWEKGKVVRTLSPPLSLFLSLSSSSVFGRSCFTAEVGGYSELCCMS